LFLNLIQTAVSLSTELEAQPRTNKRNHINGAASLNMPNIINQAKWLAVS
jgi:hypothetical protein